MLSFGEFLRGSLHGHLWESCDHTYTTFYIDCATLNVFCFSFEGNESNRSVFSIYAKYESVDLLNHKYMMEPYLAGQHLNNYLRHLSFGRATSENVFKTYLSIYYNFKKVVIDAGSVSFKTKWILTIFFSLSFAVSKL